MPPHGIGTHPGLNGGMISPARGRQSGRRRRCRPVPTSTPWWGIQDRSAGGGLRGADVETPVHLHRIHRQDFAIQLVGEFEATADFPTAVGPARIRGSGFGGGAAVRRRGGPAHEGFPQLSRDPSGIVLPREENQESHASADGHVGDVERRESDFTSARGSR